MALLLSLMRRYLASDGCSITFVSNVMSNACRSKRSTFVLAASMRAARSHGDELLLLLLLLSMFGPCASLVYSGRTTVTDPRVPASSVVTFFSSQRSGETFKKCEILWVNVQKV